jgi:hypothetical protein
MRTLLLLGTSRTEEEVDRNKGAVGVRFRKLDLKNRAETCDQSIQKKPLRNKEKYVVLLLNSSSELRGEVDIEGGVEEEEVRGEIER